ncbi:MAG: hypothetical protein OJF62_002800 [Pseudolabrys sp.]|jgi:hypothetical protein|nr:hypothetical protein [Pseudolabrys sp.]
MPARIIGTIMLGLLSLAAFSAGPPARAEVYYPWCAVYAGGANGIGSTICSFDTARQCQETVRGVGGMCQPNPAYPGPAQTRTRRQH